MNDHGSVPMSTVDDIEMEMFQKNVSKTMKSEQSGDFHVKIGQKSEA